MSEVRKFRFGVQFSNASSRTDWIDKCRRAEDLGYSTIFMPDHFGDQLGPVPALMAAADATNLRIGPLVLGNDYRHPVVLAKEAATIDLLTDGRLELGIGAGWMRSDYDQAGWSYDSPGVRIERLEEAVRVLKGFFGPDSFSFEGKHYKVQGLDGRPRPVQQPHPPLLIGGGGRRLLRLAGREADIVGINFNLKAGEVTPELGPDGTAESTERKIGWVREGAGDRFDEIELNVLVFLATVTNDRRGQAEMTAPMFNLTPEQALKVPHSLVGTVDEIAEDLRERRERFGLSYTVVNEAGFADIGPVVEKLAGT